jgi:hypothetical protein
MYAFRLVLGSDKCDFNSVFKLLASHQLGRSLAVLGREKSNRLVPFLVLVVLVVLE